MVQHLHTIRDRLDSSLEAVMRWIIKCIIVPILRIQELEHETIRIAILLHNLFLSVTVHPEDTLEREQGERGAAKWRREYKKTGSERGWREAGAPAILQDYYPCPQRRRQYTVSLLQEGYNVLLRRASNR